MSTVEIRVPDLGDFKDVGVIEVLVKPGERVEKEQPLITLESDKATMEVPATEAGIVKQLNIKVGDRVSAGHVILTLVSEMQAEPAAIGTEKQPKAPAQSQPVGKDRESAGNMPPNADITSEIVVLGAGPGGYSAAFRAADLGKQVALVERYPSLGGVCLNVGVGSSRVDLQACKLEYSIVSPK